MSIHEAPTSEGVLHAIAHVSDWRSLGTHLGIESSKLDEIEMLPSEDWKSKLVEAWFESADHCTYDKVEEALKKSANPLSGNWKEVVKGQYNCTTSSDSNIMSKITFVVTIRHMQRVSQGKSG